MQTIALDGYASDHLKGKVAVNCGGERMLMRGRGRKKECESYLLGKKERDYMKLMDKRKFECCHNSSPSMESMVIGIQQSCYFLFLASFWKEF